MIDIKTYFQQEKDKLREMTLTRKPKLWIISTTNDDASERYVRNKIKDFTEVGWVARVDKVSNSKELQQSIRVAEANGYTGIIVQHPVAPGIIFNDNMIPQGKDCDGFRQDSPVVPATARGIMDYLDECGVDVSKMHVVILGRGKTAGTPIAAEMLKRNATISICHSRTDIDTRNRLCETADLIVSAVGKPHLLHRSQCPSAIVVDVGINLNENGKLCGDFDEDTECAKMFGSWSTPVPGGVGLLTRLGLMKNCLDLM